MNHKNAETDVIIKSMKKSVAKALERKRRLGQYAVVARNGKLVHLQPEEIQPRAVAEDQTDYNSQ
jgi:hypothetical protein